MLSDNEIRRLIENYDMVIPFNDSQLQPCSYDLILGDEFTIIVNHGVQRISENRWIDASDKTLHGLAYHTTMNADQYLIQPRQLVLATTIEKVSIPDFIAAKFEGKSSLGRLGLGTHVTAGFIDAGFIGQITLEMQNVSDYPIMVRKGMKIGQLSFCKLSSPASRPYGSKQLGSHYQNQSGVQTAKGDK
jgi:dCTP deaminase